MEPKQSLEGAGGACAASANAGKAWTDCIPNTEHNSLFLNCDFSKTSLGPISAWGPALRLYAAMVFADSRSACVYWGPNQVAFYNEKYSICCGNIHPFLMGQSIRDGFPTVWEELSVIFNQGFTTGHAVDAENILLFPIRNGYVEETYFVGQFIPVRGDRGEVEGFYHTVFESTAQVLQRRRRAVIDRIAAIPPHDVDETLSSILESMQHNPHDITMAMLYSYDGLAADGDADLQLRGNIGVPQGHTSAPTAARLDTDQIGLVPFFRKTMISGRPHVISDAGDNGMFDGISWVGYGEPSRDIAVLCLRSGGTILGFYVQGINPRRAYDEDYENSVVDMARQIEGKWMSSDSFQQAKLREQALKDRATDSENRLRHMAKSAPFGMCQITPDHKIQWANDQYYEITGHDRSNPDVAAFRELIPAEERPAALDELRSLLNGDSRRVREIRMNREWTPPIKSSEEALESYAWILVSSFPLFENGKVKLVMVYVCDISHQKWAESVQTRNASAALLAKRRQEEFIDTTSHEMRNPLTAITQLADGIARSLPASESYDLTTYRQIVTDNVESANTILTCAAHQKRVIDDVLILTRLESRMLSITPVVEQISKVVSNAIKMFDGEVAMHGTNIEAVREETFSNVPIDYLLVDTSRLMQVLLNLISNAIKFSSTQSVRNVTVRYGVQASQPPRIKTSYGDLKWKESTASRRLKEVLPPLGEREERLFLYIIVQDTGTGLTEEETERLFKRFSQASSKTHITYGGSGVGLYVCRELAEKQGGGVGVASKYGDGSVFGFYIETRAACPPEDSPEKQSSREPRTVNPNSEDHNYELQHKLSSNTIAEPDAATQPLPSQSRATDQPKAYSILLVEDNLVNQKVLAKQLRMADCTVAVANHGKEALQVLEKAGYWIKEVDHPTALHSPQTVSTSSGDPEPIEIVLMDWEMPIMNGLDCCREIRRREESHASGGLRLPVIAITANVRQEQKEEAIAAGMDDVLTKPFNTADLLYKIEEVLATSSHRQGRKGVHNQ